MSQLLDNVAALVKQAEDGTRKDTIQKGLAGAAIGGGVATLRNRGERGRIDMIQRRIISKGGGTAKVLRRSNRLAEVGNRTMGNRLKLTAGAGLLAGAAYGMYKERQAKKNKAAQEQIRTTYPSQQYY